jgi:microcystin-dependent protein
MQPYLVLNFVIAQFGIFPSFSKRNDNLGHDHDATSNTTARVGGDSPTIGEIIILPYQISLSLYLPCDGRLLSIASNTVIVVCCWLLFAFVTRHSIKALFSLIGTTYGGDGTHNL